MHRSLCRRPGRHRYADLFRRHRRERARDPGTDLLRARISRHRNRSPAEHGGRGENLSRGRQGRRPRVPNGRGSHDRPGNVRHAAGVPGGRRETGMSKLEPELLARMDAYWRAANYLSVGQIYLMDNPLLREPLTLDHVKPRLLGHWGTTPGLNFIYVHLNRIIVRDDLNMLYVTGPGHGGPGIVANTWLEGTYSELYPEV